MGTKCKVAFIGHSYVESSSRQKLAYLARHTTLRLITPSYFPTPFGKFETDFCFNPEVAVDSLPVRFVNLSPTSTRWILASRDLGFKEFQPDIIHVENEHHSWIVCQALLYRRLFAPKAKVVVFTWDNIGPEDSSIKARMLERLAVINRRSVDFFICGNGAGKQILEARGLATSRVEVVPQFGVDSQMFYKSSPDRRDAARQALEICPGDFAIGFVGRFLEEKGVLDLVEASGLLKSGTRRSPVLVFMGQGPLEKQIRERCAQLGLKLRLLPARKNHEVAEIMNTLDVLVLPSQSRPSWKEQFGRVLTEAMACGVPVIGSDSGEIPNVIGDAGLIFHEGDRKALSRCLEVYCDNEVRRKAYSDCGQARVFSFFTNERVAERTLRIYERMSQ